MRYLLSNDGTTIDQYPYSFAQLRKDKPDVSYPRNPDEAKLREWGVYLVNETAKPAYDLTKNIVEGTPVFVNDVWLQMWVEEPATAEQIAQRQAAEKTSAERTELKADAWIATFVAMSPAQVSSYVDQNVTDLASAKSVIDNLARMVLLLARRELGGD